MKYDPRIHHRRSIRLAGFDYRMTGRYFVTVCAYERRCIFEDAELKAVAEGVWRTVTGAGGSSIDDFVVMPNHVHGIVRITDRTVVGARQPGGRFEEPRTPTNAAPNRDGAVASPLRTPIGPPPGSLGAIIASFKSASAKRINNLLGTPGAPVWQRNYYEHVIRDENDLLRVCQYIRDNPAKWAEDPDNPANMPAQAMRPKSPCRGEATGGRFEQPRTPMNAVPNTDGAVASPLRSAPLAPVVPLSRARERGRGMRAHFPMRNSDMNAS